MTVLFDTLQYANRLRAAGVSEKQAEVQAETFAELFENKLATKHDLKILEKNIDLKMAKLKNELIKWVLGVALGQAAIILACVQLSH